MTIEQAAVYIGRTPKAVRCLLTKDAFPQIKADGRVMIDVKDLDLWIERNKEQSTLPALMSVTTGKVPSAEGA